MLHYSPHAAQLLSERTLERPLIIFLCIVVFVSQFDVITGRGFSVQYDVCVVVPLIAHTTSSLILYMYFYSIQVKPLWPISTVKKLLIKPTLSPFISKAFPYNCSHTSVLRMVQPKAICVEVHGDVEGSVTTVLFTPYSPGVGTIRIENLCDDVILRFCQE